MNDNLRQLLNEGFLLFNQREFFACHEILEELWKQEREPERQFTQGVIQVAVGYYHLLRNNKKGASKLLIRGRERLKAFAPQYAGLKVSNLICEVDRTLSQLDNLDYCEITIPLLEFVSDLQ